jgi:hypothetical protein
MRTDDPSFVEAVEYASVNPLVSGESLPADLLANASCLQCGYSLRGLTENRCPECGTPFDLREMASSYLPEWPRLMAWYLIAQTTTCGLSVVSIVLYGMGYSPSILSALALRPTSFGYLFEMVVGVCLAPVAVVGLWRRFDWGRKTAIAMLLLQALPAALLLVVAICAFTLSGFSGQSGYSLSAASEIISFTSATGLPAMILACLLWTGLRRRSLRRRSWQPLRTLPIQAFHPRWDWPILLVCILVAGSLAKLGSTVSGVVSLMAVFSNVPFSSRGASRWWLILSFGSTMAASAFLCGWIGWTAACIWREPARAPRRLKTLTFVIAGVSIAVCLRWLITDLPRFSYTPTQTSGPPMASALVSVIAATVVPLALYLYASRALPAGAVNRVTKLPTGPAPEEDPHSV